jgi:hypothetical protein
MTVRVYLAALVIGSMLALPFQASAVTFEDSFENCSYPKMLDLMMIRPVGAAASVIGTTLFVPLGLIGALTVPNELGTIYSSLVAEPWAFVLDRPLGECSSISLTY